MGKFTFGKKERLSKENDIKELFEKGSSFYLYPFKVLRYPGSAEHVEVLISVSRRNFKSAVARNSIKRRIREAYRLNKAILSSASGLRLGFIYTAKEMLPTKQISEKMVHALRKIFQLTHKAEKNI